MPWFWQGVLLLIFTVPVIVLFGYATWDVVRRDDASILVRFAWLVAFCVLPLIGPLVYLAFRPPGTTADQRRVAAGGPAVSTAQELTALAELHDRGKLTDHEYETAKAQHVGVDLSDVGPGSVHQPRGGQML